MTSENTEQFGCNTQDMVLVHAVMRRAFADAVEIVARVPAGDTERVRVVADHVEEVAQALHHHHHNEDVELWDKLESRAPSCALHVGRMRAQHAAIADRLAELEKVMPAWRATATADDGERVRAGLAGVSSALVEHLGDEEANILPVAGTNMTQKEWDALAEAGRATVPKNRLFIQLGFILDSIPEQDRDRWMRDFLPLPARLLYTLMGRRQYEKHRKLVYGDLA